MNRDASLKIWYYFLGASSVLVADGQTDNIRLSWLKVVNVKIISEYFDLKSVLKSLKIDENI